MRSSQGVCQILKTSQNKYFWVELLVWGVRKGDTTLIWGYAESYNSDLGVREYQKVENPWDRWSVFYGQLIMKYQWPWKIMHYSTCLKLNKILFDFELIFAAKGNYRLFAFSKQMLWSTTYINLRLSTTLSWDLVRRTCRDVLSTTIL